MSLLAAIRDRMRYGGRPTLSPSYGERGKTGFWVERLL
jgi:hypothetical protein